MPKTLIVGTEEFEFPIEGENAGYGEQVTDWAEAVTEALTTVQQPNDILVTTALIANNVSSLTNVTGFIFDTSEVISIDAQYIVSRSTVSPAVSVTQSGRLEGNYNGSTWSISHSFDGEAGVRFDITNGGQVQYTSTDMSGTSYVGSIIFKAKVFNQE
jgi:hypothetical protein